MITFSIKEKFNSPWCRYS